jgi:hypothetical protein
MTAIASRPHVSRERNSFVMYNVPYEATGACSKS